MSRSLIIRDAILARQLKADAKARGIARRLSATLNLHWPAILKLIPDSPRDLWQPHRLANALTFLRAILQRQLHGDLMGIGHWAGTGAARSLGAAYQRHFGESLLIEDDREPGEPFPSGGGPPPDPFERFKIGGLVQPPTFAEIERIVAPYSRFQFTKLLNPARINDTVWSGIAQGQDRRAIAKTLQGLLNGDLVAARRVARTSGATVATQSQLAVSEQLADEIIGYQVHAVPKTLYSRPDHLKRSGTIYYRHPRPGQLGFDKMPQPPIDPGGVIEYNCRCWISPVFAAEPVPTHDAYGNRPSLSAHKMAGAATAA